MGLKALTGLENPSWLICISDASMEMTRKLGSAKMPRSQSFSPVSEFLPLHMNFPAVQLDFQHGSSELLKLQKWKLLNLEASIQNSAFLLPHSID